MKSFMKIIVTLIVLGVIAFVVGFLLMNPQNIKPSTEVNSGESKNINLDSIEKVVEEKNSDKGLAKEDIIAEIDKQVTAINYNGIVDEFDKRLTEEETTNSVQEFMKYFNVKDLLVKVRIKKGCIEMIPYSDFIENMVYYFDGAGNLILFESVSTTVGGSCKYYFQNGELVDTIVAYNEKTNNDAENATDILKRAKNIFDNYGSMFKKDVKNNKEYPMFPNLSGEEKVKSISGESGD